MLSFITRQRQLAATISLAAYFFAHFAAEPLHRFSHIGDQQIGHSVSQALTAETGEQIVNPESGDSLCLFVKVLASALKWTPLDATDTDLAAKTEFAQQSVVIPERAIHLRPWIDAHSARGPPFA